MTDSAAGLRARLAAAQLELQSALSRVSHLEAELHQQQPTTVPVLAYQRTLDQFREGCQVLGFDWHYLYLNEAAAAHGRRRREDLLGRRIMDCYPGVEQTTMFQALQQVMDTRSPTELEHEFFYPDGMSAWFELRVQPVPEGIFILSLDITRRKHAEADLQRYTRRLEILHDFDRSLARGESISALIATTLQYVSELIPAQGMGIVLFEPAINEMVVHSTLLQVPSDLHQGRRMPMPPTEWFRLFNAQHQYYVADLAHLPQRFEFYNHAFQEGVRSVLHSQLQIGSEVLGLLNLLDRRVDAFSADDCRLAQSIADQLAIAVHQLRLTEQLQAYTQELESRIAERTHALSAAKERVEAILDNSLDGILFIDPQFRVQQTNAGFCRMVETEPDQVQERVFLDWVVPEDVLIVESAVRLALELGQDRRIQAHLISPSDAPREVEIGVRQVMGGLVLTLHDISEHHRAQRALHQALEAEKELNNLKTRFVAMASHELRTPLASILATTETLSIYRQRLTEDAVDTRLETIRKRVQHMTGLVDDILLLGRLQAGRLDVQMLRVDLDVLCREFVRDLPSRVSYSGPSAPVWSIIDSRTFQQALQNLISNALKFSPESTPVTLTLRPEGQEVLLSVQDEGIGIPADELEQIFEPFHRAINVGAVQGTGLGLTIARQAVERVGGRLQVESHLQAGATFTIILPAAPQTA